MRERTDGDRDRDRQAGRQADTETKRQTGRQTDRQRQTETDRDRQRQTETDRDRQRQTETDRETDSLRQSLGHMLFTTSFHLVYVMSLQKLEESPSNEENGGLHRLGTSWSVKSS